MCIIIVFACIVIISLIAFIALSFLKSSSPSCQEGEYFDTSKNRCLSCSFGCLRCKSGLDNRCYSCVGTMYKILKNYEDEMGVCSFECRGTLIKANLCVDPSIWYLNFLLVCYMIDKMIEIISIYSIEKITFFLISFY